MLKDRLSGVEERIVGACGKAGRPREEVTLIAVTKMFSASTIADAYELGLRHFGENYVQEFGAKRAQLPELPGATFHLIGHLQSNKSKAAAELFQVIQTVDTPKLSRRLNDAVQKMDVMIEVRLSEEESKHGAMAEDLPGLVNAVRECPGLRLLGLMTVPPWSTDAELSRPYFRRLRELAEAHGLRALSMGMSNDFEVAIEEGATHIRVGTALFGSRRKT